MRKTLKYSFLIYYCTASVDSSASYVWEASHLGRHEMDRGLKVGDWEVTSP